MPAQKPGSSKQDYGTPDDFLTAAKAYLGIEDFDIDLAASPENAVTGCYYTADDDALVQPWKVGDGWNWLNPEYSRIEPWVQRAYEQAQLGARTAVLIPASVGANWWARWVHSHAHIVLLNGRLQFKGAIGLYPKDCALLLYAAELPPEYTVWAWKGFL